MPGGPFFTGPRRGGIAHRASPHPSPQSLYRLGIGAGRRGDLHLTTPQRYLGPRSVTTGLRNELGYRRLAANKLLWCDGIMRKNRRIDLGFPAVGADTD